MHSAGRRRTGHDDELERAIHAACDRGDYATATELLLRGYGPEILGYLHARLRHDSDADEVFQRASFDVWRGLPDFGWRCPVRLWAYALARNASGALVKSPARRRARNVPLSQAGRVATLAAEVRSSTARHLRTENKSRVRALRAQLADDEQELLILRVDKRMAWRQLAQLLVFDGGDATPAELEREAARLRKRYQLLKQKLRHMAVEAGLIQDGER